ncbi:MAG: hypothetical protein ACAI44_29240 [Candidatus Sericytochromatia bacterium]
MPEPDISLPSPEAAKAFAPLSLGRFVGYLLIQLLSLLVMRYELAWVGLNLGLADEPWNYLILPGLVLVFWLPYELCWYTLKRNRDLIVLAIPLLWWLLEALFLLLALWVLIEGPSFELVVEQTLDLGREIALARFYLLLVCGVQAMKVWRGLKQTRTYLRQRANRPELPAQK